MKKIIFIVVLIILITFNLYLNSIAIKSYNTIYENRCTNSQNNQEELLSLADEKSVMECENSGGCMILTGGRGIVKPEGIFMGINMGIKYIIGQSSGSQIDIIQPQCIYPLD